MRHEYTAFISVLNKRIAANFMPGDDFRVGINGDKMGLDPVQFKTLSPALVTGNASAKCLICLAQKGGTCNCASVNAVVI